MTNPINEHFQNLQKSLEEKQQQAAALEGEGRPQLSTVLKPMLARLSVLERWSRGKQLVGKIGQPEREALRSIIADQAAELREELMDSVGIYSQAQTLDQIHKVRRLIELHRLAKHIGLSMDKEARLLQELLAETERRA